MITGVIFSVPERDCRELVANARRMVDDLYIIDDPRTLGKKLFWKRMREAISYCLSGDNDWFVFLHDDLRLTRPDAIIDVMEALDQHYYSIELVNDGRECCWGGRSFRDLDVTVAGESLKHTNYNDCKFFTNRRSLENVQINPVPNQWFDRPGKSSGVGAQLTREFNRLRVPMFAPERSFVHHGHLDSVMHPEERKINPLISL